MTTNKDLAAVLAEMRERANGWKHGAHPSVTAEYVLECADCIESALLASAEPVSFQSRFKSEGHSWREITKEGFDSPCPPEFERRALYAHAPAVQAEPQGREPKLFGGLDEALRARGLPIVAYALDYSRNFAEASPSLTQTAKYHITGLCDMLEIAAAHQATPPASVPDGYAVVPAKMYVSPKQWDAAQFAFGGPGSNAGEPFYACTLWIGEIENDDESKTHGLHVSCDECPEEGAITLSEFASPPTTPEPRT